jgi:hypothetical protein
MTFIYLIQIINSIHTCKNDIHPYETIHLYGHIHPCRWIKTTLNFKFLAQSSKLMPHAHAQTIFNLQHHGLRHLMLLQKWLILELTLFLWNSLVQPMWKKEILHVCIFNSIASPKSHHLLQTPNLGQDVDKWA